MKKILFILIALLIPVFLYARGSKPSSVGTVTGDVTISSGTVTANVAGDVGINNLADQEPVQRDSTTSGALTGQDTATVAMTTGVKFGNVKGYYRFGYIPNASCDSVKVQYRFVNGTFGLTRWLPLYVDSVSVAGNAPAYVTTNGIVTYLANVPYWALLYDPASTNPMGCIPKKNDKIEFRFVNTGYDDVTFTCFKVWQEN